MADNSNMDSHRSSRRSNNGAKHKYPEQHRKLVEMGFDVKSINSALESSSGDLQATTSLLVEKVAASIRNARRGGGSSSRAITNNEDPSSSIPMKVVGKSKATKAEIMEAHNKFMSIYKTTKCKDKGNHDKRMCFYWHTKSDRRRNPFDVLYSCSECPNSTETAICENGDTCLKAHNMLERMFHPELFKISMCQRGPNGDHCERGNLCAFAHSEEDHRVPLSQTAAKSNNNNNNNNATSSNHGGSGVPAAASMHLLSANEYAAINKSLGDSKLLDSIQDRLVHLIQSQGAEGIISSELPKKYSDVYSERLELADESGEKFRIKDLLLAHPNVGVIMHKGVQPKYVYNEVVVAAPVVAVTKEKHSLKASKAATTMASPADSSCSIATVVSSVAPLSYCSAATTATTTTTTNAKSGRSAPLNYAAAVTESINNPSSSSISSSSEKVAASYYDTSTSSSSSSSSHLSKEIYNGWHTTPSSSLDPSHQHHHLDATTRTSNNNDNSSSCSVHQSTSTHTIQQQPHQEVSSSSSSSLPGVIEPASPIVLVGGGRRRGPDHPPLPTLDGPPSPSNSINNDNSINNNSNNNNNNKGAYIHPPGNLSVSYSDVSSGKTHINNGENHQQSIQHLHKLKLELDKKSMEYDLQSKHLQEVLLKLTDFESQQTSLYGQRESAIAEAYRARLELEEFKSTFDERLQKSSEICARDYTISHLSNERSMDLHQYFSSINQIEIALVEMQRKEALYINEIPLHDTINESSRARDELTKFVSLLKMQINAKIVNETSSTATIPHHHHHHSAINNNHSLLNLNNNNNTLSNNGNGVSGSEGGISHGYAPSASYRSSFGSHHSSMLSPVGTPAYLLTAIADNNLLVIPPAPPAAPPAVNRSIDMNMNMNHRTHALSTEDDDAFRRIMMISGGGANNSHSGQNISMHGNGHSAFAGGGGGGGRKIMKVEGCVCGLPGCHLEGTFICSACNRTGYCGSEHQR